MSAIDPAALPYALALANLTDEYLKLNGGCFPLDGGPGREAMLRAYALIGQPNTPARIERLDSWVVVGYRAGVCRNAESGTRKSHTYAMMNDGELVPMCPLGWNRSDGGGFSILRSPPGTEGDCAICRKNVAAGKQPLFDGANRKTKWL